MWPHITVMVWSLVPQLLASFPGLKRGQGYSAVSLVPRPHPLTRRNGLVNQVKFLKHVHTHAKASPSGIQKQTRSKKVQIVEYIYTVAREVLYVIITDLAISLVLTTFGE